LKSAHPDDIPLPSPQCLGLCCRVAQFLVQQQILALALSRFTPALPQVFCLLPRNTPPFVWLVDSSPQTLKERIWSVLFLPKSRPRTPKPNRRMCVALVAGVVASKTPREGTGEICDFVRRIAPFITMQATRMNNGNTSHKDRNAHDYIPEKDGTCPARQRHFTERTEPITTRTRHGDNCIVVAAFALSSTDDHLHSSPRNHSSLGESQGRVWGFRVDETSSEVCETIPSAIPGPSAAHAPHIHQSEPHWP